MDFIQPTKGKFIFKSVSLNYYNTYAKQHQCAKKVKVSGIAAWPIGAGVIDIVKEITTGVIKTWGRRKIGAAILSSAAYICTPLAILVTN